MGCIGVARRLVDRRHRRAARYPRRIVLQFRDRIVFDGVVEGEAELALSGGTMIVGPAVEALFSSCNLSESTPPFDCTAKETAAPLRV